MNTNLFLVKTPRRNHNMLPSPTESVGPQMRRGVRLKAGRGGLIPQKIAYSSNCCEIFEFTSIDDSLPMTGGAGGGNLPEQKTTKKYFQNEKKIKNENP